MNLPRAEQLFKITDIKYLLPDFALLSFSAPEAFIASCMMPGTYIFARDPKTPHYYDTPLSIMHTDLKNRTVTIGIRILAAKTHFLTSPDDDSVIIRGPYRNAIPGLDSKMKGKNITIIAKGAGTCPAVFAYERLKNSNDISLIFNDEILEHKLYDLYLSHQPDAHIGFCDLNEKEFEPYEGTDCFIVLGCSQFTDSVSRRLSEAHLAAAVYTSRNDVVCCGEGVCGACGKVQTPSGPVPACKVR